MAAGIMQGDARVMVRVQQQSRPMRHFSLGDEDHRVVADLWRDHSAEILPDRDYLASRLGLIDDGGALRRLS